MTVKFFLGRSCRRLIFRILWSSCEESPTQFNMMLGQDPSFIPVRILQEVVPGANENERIIYIMFIYKVTIFIKKKKIWKIRSLYPGPLIELKNVILRKNFPPGPGSEIHFWLLRSTKQLAITITKRNIH